MFWVFSLFFVNDLASYQYLYFSTIVKMQNICVLLTLRMNY